MKSAYEVALERLESQGIEKPSKGALTDETRARVAEARQKARADLAQLEILHRDRLARLADPAARQEERDNYLRERLRIEERLERSVRKLRAS